jgi:membrane protease YdiL (CAAX protease family)
MNTTNIKPLNIWWSLILVLIPAGTAALLIHFVIPGIIRKHNIPFLYAYLPWWIGLMSLYFVGSLIAYRLEGNPLTLSHFANRFRLRKIQGRDWLWFAALLTTFVIVMAGVALWGKELSSLPGLSMPTEFPAELNPSKPGGMVPGEFMGVSLKGQWWIAVVYFIGWVLNIFGEEFWFRGYILPRQEAAYGKWAWSVHGLIWALNHVWQVWTLVILLPYSFLWSFIIQRGKNTWIPIIIHGLGNLIPLILIIVGVIG